MYEVGNKTFAFNKHVHSNEAYHHSFSLLAQKTFGLSFQNWTDKYIPHVLLDGENVVSNVSVNIIDTMWKGSFQWQAFFHTQPLKDVKMFFLVSRLKMRRIVPCP